MRIKFKANKMFAFNWNSKKETNELSIKGTTDHILFVLLLFNYSRGIQKDAFEVWSVKKTQ